MPKIFISSGHSKKDKGAIVNDIAETDINMAIRDKVKEFLPDAVYIPDNLTLRETIDFINQTAQPEDLAVEIHLNSNQSQLRRGTEAYYANDPKIAEIFSRCVSKKLDIPNNGARHDSTSYVGSLGFLRFTKCRSVLVEIAYLTNLLDRSKIITEQGQKLAAEGILDAIQEVGQPIPIPEPAITNWKGVFDTLKKVMSFDEIIRWIKKYFAIVPRPV